MNITQAYNGMKCCPVCATNLETIWMALKMAMPISNIQRIEAPAPAPEIRQFTPQKRHYTKSAIKTTPSIITPQQKEHARQLKAQGVVVTEISRLTGIKKNSLGFLYGAKAAQSNGTANHSTP